MSRRDGQTPEAVPARATRAGDAQEPPGSRDWAWAEPSVWTERMLAALEVGVKGGKWYSLMDHIKWPNVFFAKQGLFSLQVAHAQARQSSRR